MVLGRLQHIEGFTLAEALLAAAVLAMTVTAIVFPFTAAAMNQATEARTTMATLLAEDLLEEILAKPFRDPQGQAQLGPDSGESSRLLFDNIDDYDGYLEAEGNIVSSDSSTVDDPAAVGLSRSVSTTYVYVSGQDGSEPPNFIRVDVIVRYREQPLVSVTRLVHWFE